MRLNTSGSEDPLSDKLRYRKNFIRAHILRARYAGLSLLRYILKEEVFCDEGKILGPMDVVDCRDVRLTGRWVWR
jgi:hypothetical protein